MMHFTFGSYKTKIKVPVVDCDVPLLIAKETLKVWEVIQNYQTDTIYIGKTKETIKLKNLKSGHYGIKLGTDREDKDDLMKCFMTRSDNLDKPDQISKIKKVHRYLGHPTEEQMQEVYQKQRSYSTKVARNIKLICEECRLCSKYSKTKPGEPDSVTEHEETEPMPDPESLLKKYQELEEHPSLLDSDSEPEQDSDSEPDSDSYWEDTDLEIEYDADGLDWIDRQTDRSIRLPDMFRLTNPHHDWTDQEKVTALENLKTRQDYQDNRRYEWDSIDKFVPTNIVYNFGKNPALDFWHATLNKPIHLKRTRAQIKQDRINKKTRKYE